MATIRFQPSGLCVRGVPRGAALIDVADEHLAAGVPFSCRSATCGTCRVEVLDGADGLAPAGEEERELLALLAEGPAVRLCCKLEVAAGSDDATIVLRIPTADDAES